MKLPLTIAQPGKLMDADGETIAQLRDTNDAARIVVAVNHADALAEALHRRLGRFDPTDPDFAECSPSLFEAYAVLAAYAAAKEAQP